MNIDEYQAMVAQEKSDAESVQAEQTQETEVVEETSPTPEATTEATTEESKPTDSTPEKITIDGLGEVTLEDIKEWKNGHLRTQDYTKKTQEVARLREEHAQAIELFNFVKSNPNVAEVLLNAKPTSQQAEQALVSANPFVAKQNQLEQQLADLMLEREISTLQAKYADFNVVDVLNMAQTKQLTNLEDAYKLSIADKPKDQADKQDNVSGKQEVIDLEKIKADLRKDLLKELESERNTSSIISSNSSQVPSTKSDEPQLTPQQLEVALKQGLTPAEYAKWLDPKQK